MNGLVSIFSHYFAIHTHKHANIYIIYTPNNFYYYHHTSELICTPMEKNTILIFNPWKMIPEFSVVFAD